MSIFIVTSLIVIILAVSFLFKQYSALMTILCRIDYNKEQINIQLDKRFNTFQSLIIAVRDFMDYERSTLKEVSLLRARAEAALTMGDEKTRIAAENDISKIAFNLPTIFAQYPELKAGKNVLQLQEEIANNEARLAYAKQIYNESISRFLLKKSALLDGFIVKSFPKKLDKTYITWS